MIEEMERYEQDGEMPDQMTSYKAHKLVTATPMTRQEYHEHRAWDLPEDDTSEDEGYLVECMQGKKSNHDAHSGYISWEPKEVFEEGYSLQEQE